MERFLNDLSKVWNELSEDTQKDLAKMIAGERSASDLVDLLIRNSKDSNKKANCKIRGLRRETSILDESSEMLNEKKMEDFYKNYGVAIFVKGKMVIGIYPDNVENNLKALANGDAKIDWNRFI